MPIRFPQVRLIQFDSVSMNVRKSSLGAAPPLGWGM